MRVRSYLWEGTNVIIPHSMEVRPRSGSRQVSLLRNVARDRGGYSETIMLPRVALSLTLPQAPGRVHAR